MNTWTNWSGSVVCTPQQICTPTSEDELCTIVRNAAGAGQQIRLVGAGHSFLPLCATNDVLISLDKLCGLIEADAKSGTATFWAGTRIYAMGQPLLDVGLAMENMGDIDRQSIAGAISTGTHGTGRRLGNLSTQVVGLRLITAAGEPVALSASEQPALFKAAQVSLGALGIITQVTLRVLPAYRLHERTWVEPFDALVDKLDEYVTNNRHFEFFWIPSEDVCACKALNPTELAELPHSEEQTPPGKPMTRYVGPERIDWSYRIFPSDRDRKFNEIEFAVPAARGPECLHELRALMQNAHRDVLWPIEYRTLAADDIPLSTASKRETVTLSLHQKASLPYNPFFFEAESIFRRHDGRPHWGKIHTHTADDLRRLYPQWDEFCAIRHELDGEGLFLNDYLRTLFL